MRKIGIGRGLVFGCVMAGLFLLGGPAAAEDGLAKWLAPVTGAPQWGGFYAGGAFGGTWSQQDWQYTNANYFNTQGSTLLGSDFALNDGDAIGGLFAGYNYQTGPWVLGLEVSELPSEIKTEGRSPFFPATVTHTSQVNWLTTVTGRLGYAWDRWLVFGKGGWAGADVDLKLHATDDGTLADENTWANGWTLGVGAEYRLRKGVSLGLAYDYVDLGIDDWTVTCPTCGTGVGRGTPVVDGDIKVYSLMARLSFSLEP